MTVKILIRHSLFIGEILLCLIAFCSLSNAQALEKGHWREWKSADGLAEAYTTRLTQGLGDRILITHGEINHMSLFDGYTVEHCPNPGGSLRVYENRNKDLWSIYSGGFLRLEGEQWVRYPISQIQEANYTVDFAPAETSHLLFLLRDRLMAYDIQARETIEIHNAADTEIGPFTVLIPTRSGGIWVAGDRGAGLLSWPKNQFDEHSWTEFPLGDIEASDLTEIHEGDGGVLFATALEPRQRHSLLLYLSNGSWTVLNENHPRMVRGWGRDARDYWLQDGRDLYHILQDQERKVSLPASLTGIKFDVLNQPNGIFWIASSEGLTRFAPSLWQNPFKPEFNDFVHSIYEDPQGRIWFLSQDKLLLNQGGDWKQYLLPYPSNRQESNCLWVLPNGLLAISCASSNLLLFNPQEERFSEVPHPEGLIVGVQTGRKDGSLLVQAHQANYNYFQIEVFDGESFQTLLNRENTWDIGALRYIYEAKNGDLWFGGIRGLSRYSQGEYKLFTNEDGFMGEGAFVIEEVKEGEIWIGERNRLWSYKSERFQILRSGYDGVRAILATEPNTVWVASGNGVDRYQEGNWIRNTDEDGLSSSVVFDVLQDSQGRIWAGSSLGINQFHRPADLHAPETLLDPLRNPRQVSSEGNTQITFSGQDRWKYNTPDRLLYSYRINRGDWSPFEPNENISLTNLRYGDHRIEVRAMDRNMNIDSTPAVFDFTVQLPWYAQSGFILIVSIAALTITFLIFLALRYHIRQEQTIVERTAKLREANRLLLEDIENRRKSQEEKTHLEEQLRHAQKMEAIGRLSGGVAHDFNNLLTVIQGHLNLLSLNTHSEKEIRYHVDEIQRASTRASSLTNQLLLYSRKQVLHMGIINLQEIVQDMHRMLKRLLGEDIELEAIVQKDLGNIKSDKSSIEQLIMNLAVNARDAMPGGGKLTLEVRNITVTEYFADQHIDLEPGDYVLLSVSDNGAGMDKETQGRIFEPFFTTKEMGKGTGLGLSTAYGIVKQSGGTIWCYSEVGSGTTFKIYFPRCKEDYRESAGSVIRSQSITSQEVRSEAILLVEDEESLRNLIKNILQMRGYRILEAKNGVEGLQIAQSWIEPLHLLITDVIMPIMGGRELATNIRGTHPEIKVLFISGYTDTAIVQHGMLDESMQYLQKPFTPDELLQHVDDALQNG